MTLVGSIDIEFYDSGTAGDLLTLLRRAGWEDGGETILYQHYRRIEDYPGEDLSAPISEWDRVCAELDRFSAAGELVQVRLYWEGSGPSIECVFESATHLRIHFDGSRPILADCHPFTDYSWLLQRILRPWRDADTCILRVDCHDSWY